uniref:Glycoprotein hormone subunit beta domain-containing protein n=1 Tax=Poecilia mexicana TaxID=48701 RepID=A0A3B3WNN5_9TELE
PTFQTPQVLVLVLLCIPRTRTKQGEAACSFYAPQIEQTSRKLVAQEPVFPFACFQDPNRKILFSKAYQHVCTYGELYYKTFEFSDCLPGVDPVVTYPVALRCHCGGCAMATSDCTFESLQPDIYINYIPFYH